MLGNDELEAIWQAADQDADGYVNVGELQAALGTRLHFSLKSCGLLLTLFDGDKDGKLNHSEFEFLAKYVSQCEAVFDYFDSNYSGQLEAQQALDAIGYSGYGHLEESAVKKVCMRFDPDTKGALTREQFIATLAFLSSASKVFKAYDQDNQGQITLDLHQFVYAAGMTH